MIEKQIRMIKRGLEEKENERPHLMGQNKE
jgi:hypothetical protein